MKLVYHAKTQRRKEDACFLFAPLRLGVRFIPSWPLGHVSSCFSILLACVLPLASLSCVKLPRRILHASGQTASPASQLDAALININTASPEELEKLPGIGRALAARIVAYRSDYGRFRRTEHLMMVRGISERRYRTMRALITAE